MTVSKKIIRISISLMSFLSLAIFWLRMNPEVSSGPPSVYWPEQLLLNNFTSVVVDAKVSEQDSLVTNINSDDLKTLILSECTKVFVEHGNLRNINIVKDDFSSAFEKHPMSLGLTFYLTPARSTVPGSPTKWELTYSFTRIRSMPYDLDTKDLNTIFNKNTTKREAFDLYPARMRHPKFEEFFLLPENKIEKQTMLANEIKKKCNFLAGGLHPNSEQSEKMENIIIKIKPDLE